MNANEKILGEMGFDSSLHNTMDSKLSAEEYRGRLMGLLQPILDQRFPGNAGKRKVHPHIDRISFACPYCGDSMKSDYKHRGNFILRGKHQNFFKCHNCGEFKRIDTFFKDYNVTLNLDAVNYIMDNLGDFTSYAGAKYDMSVMLNMEHLDEYAIDRQELKEKFNLVEVKTSSVWTWLTHRLQFREEKFLYSPTKNYVLILNLTPSGKILGAQKRGFKGPNRFETYKLSKLYEYMGKELKVNEEQLDYLDTLSMIFDICLISFNKPITMFEGPMDAFLFKNSIANTGANKDLPIEIPVRYFYDSDETGKRRSLQHIQQEHEVFLWDKLLREVSAPYRKKWDLNDILLWAKENGKKINIADTYFSSDPFDALDI